MWYDVIWRDMTWWWFYSYLFIFCSIRSHPLSSPQWPQIDQVWSQKHHNMHKCVLQVGQTWMHVTVIWASPLKHLDMWIRWFSRTVWIHLRIPRWSMMIINATDRGRWAHAPCVVLSLTAIIVFIVPVQANALGGCCADAFQLTTCILMQWNGAPQQLMAVAYCSTLTSDQGSVLGK